MVSKPLGSLKGSMAIWRAALFAALLAGLAGMHFAAVADVTVEDPRYCGEPARNQDGTIKRSDSVRRRFQYLYPCPSTGRQVGACPQWSKDHVIPLAQGGCDSIGNMQWMPDAIKSCAAPTCKDRWEQRVYRH